MKLFPAMLLHSWWDTKETLHRFCQIVGKVRLAASVRRNHWWHAPFHLTGRGITTQPMGRSDGRPVFADDTTRAGYDPAWATRYWRVLSQVNLLLEEFAAGYEGKVSRAPFLAHLRHHSQPVLGPPGSTRSRPPTRSLGRPARGR
jgi:hypothetical protein